MKKYTGIIAGIAVLALIVFILFENKKKTTAQTSSEALTDNTEVVSTFKVSESPVRKQFSSNAAVQALKELNFSSDISGRVIRIFVDNGSKVREGSPLLEIYSELIKADYQAALAAYNALLKDEQRFSRSNAAGGISDQQLDNIRTQLQAAQSRLTVSKWKLDNSVVKSPINGTVNARYVETGSLIAPNVPLFEIVDDSAMKLVCMVPESKLSQISIGEKVTASSGAHVFTGRVNSIGIKTDRGMNYPVEVILEGDDALRVGMYLTVNFRSEKEQSCILVPRKAIVGSAIAANVYLAIDGKAVRREVKPGDMYGNDIEIVEGLEDGDEIIVSGLMNISDGSDIKIVK